MREVPLQVLKWGGFLCARYPCRYVRMYEPGSGRDIPLLSIRRASGPSGVPRALAYNEAERALLLCTDAEGGSYELYQIPRDASRGASEAPDSKRV